MSRPTTAPSAFGVQWQSTLKSPPSVKFPRGRSKSQLEWIIYRAKQLPAPNEYNLGTTIGKMRTGKIGSSRPKTHVEIIEARSRQVPAPDYYQRPKTVDPARLKGVRFSNSFPKNYIEWTEYYAKQLPGPSEYRLPTPKQTGGKFSEARPKTSTEWIIYHAKQLPGPNRYRVRGKTRYGSSIPGGGRIGRGNPLGYIQLEINRTKDNPAPGDYDLVKLPPSNRKSRFRRKKKVSYSARSNLWEQVGSLVAMSEQPRTPLPKPKSYALRPKTSPMSF